MKLVTHKDSDFDYFFVLDTVLVEVVGVLVIGWWVFHLGDVFDSGVLNWRYGPAAVALLAYIAALAEWVSGFRVMWNDLKDWI